jgi:hypothetical protein
LSVLGGTFGRLLVMGIGVMVVAAGLCLLDGDDSGGADLCTLPLVTTLTIPVAITLPLAGRSIPALAIRHPSYAPDPLAPPPKA